MHSGSKGSKEPHYLHRLVLYTFQISVICHTALTLQMYTENFFWYLPPNYGKSFKNGEMGKILE